MRGPSDGTARRIATRVGSGDVTEFSVLSGRRFSLDARDFGQVHELDQTDRLVARYVRALTEHETRRGDDDGDQGRRPRLRAIRHDESLASGNLGLFRLDSRSLFRLVDRLTQQYRQVLAALVVLDHDTELFGRSGTLDSLEETAEMLNQNINTLKVRVHRARQRLADELKRILHEEALTL